ncbi:MAG: AAA family ATPase, partial [Holosporales bacterium]|nr:AAA family ATPase [Holosporales bacterium]
MSKSFSKFICQECGAISSKWLGQCDICKAWNSIIEEVNFEEVSKKNILMPKDFFVGVTQGFKEVQNRRMTYLNELNRVLGGGLVDGSVILLGGPPGIGKSTLLLQILSKISDNSIKDFVYISAEESINQVLLRADRLSASNPELKIASSYSIHQIISSLSSLRSNGIVVIDSIQTISSDLVQSPPGSISQVRFCTQELVNFAKKKDITIIIVGHITKDGTIAGPKTLEHMVDCVLYF